MHYLRMTGWYVMRLNSGKFAIGEGAGRRFVVGQDAGTPDLVAFKMHHSFSSDHACNHVRLVFIEVKRPGNKPTPTQLAKMEELRRYGARCFVATSLEDVQRELGGAA